MPLHPDNRAAICAQADGSRPARDRPDPVSAGHRIKRVDASVDDVDPVEPPAPVVPDRAFAHDISGCKDLPDFDPVAPNESFDRQDAQLLNAFQGTPVIQVGGFGVEQVGSTSLVGDAIGAISRHIREKDLMPGDKLPSEALLSKELNVSRTVVREAFRSLAAMRIIDLATGKRATVAQIDHGAMSLMIEHGVHTDQINIQQIYDVRRTIESRIVTLAALRRSDEEAAQIVALAAAMRADMADPARIMEHDLAFHMALARASRNPVYALLIGAFQGITRQTWPIGWKSRPTQAARDLMLDTHADIARAIAGGDPQGAAAAMLLHFDESVRALLSAGMS